MSIHEEVQPAMPFTIYESPFGPLTLVAGADGLRRLFFPRRAPALDERDHDPQRLPAASEQLEQYFRGERHDFDIPLALEGNSFELSVWAALCEIPYGETVSYGQIARALGHPDAPRAVGAANGRNPVAIIVPCHRVIGANGSLTGYGGGLERKRFLLDLEAGVIPLTA
jgi:methylated-DNA-[protein]-cysteine S-methyltransferase